MAVAGRSYPNVPIISRGSLENPTDFNSPTRVVIVTSQPYSRPIPTTTFVRNTLQDPLVLTTPSPVVTSLQNHRNWFATNTPQRYRNTLQDPPVLTTPSPVVVSSPNPKQLYNWNQPITSVNPFIPAVVLSTTPSPIVVSGQPARSWYSINTPQDFRNTLQDPPVLTTSQPIVVSTPVPPKQFYNYDYVQTSAAPVIPIATPSPIVVSSQPAPLWLAVKPPQVLDNIQLGTTPTFVATPSPIVVTGPRSLLYQPTRITVIDNIQLGTTATFVRPICYSGTLIDENVLAGSIIDDLILSGSIIHSFAFGGTLVDENVFTGTMKGWCMQEVDITAAEFNDESWDFTITAGSSPYPITGLTIEMYFKVAAGDSDTAPTTVKLTTPTDIVITDGPNGKGTASLSSTNLQPGDIYGFYRLDIIQSTKRHTALYGKVGILSL